MRQYEKIPPYQQIEVKTVAKDTKLKPETVFRVLESVDYFTLSEENEDLRDRLDKYVEKYR